MALRRNRQNHSREMEWDLVLGLPGTDSSLSKNRRPRILVLRPDGEEEEDDNSSPSIIPNSEEEEEVEGGRGRLWKGKGKGKNRPRESTPEDRGRVVDPANIILEESLPLAQGSPSKQRPSPAPVDLAAATPKKTITRGDGGQQQPVASTTVSSPKKVTAAPRGRDGHTTPRRSHFGVAGPGGTSTSVTSEPQTSTPETPPQRRRQQQQQPLLSSTPTTPHQRRQQQQQSLQSLTPGTPPKFQHQRQRQQPLQSSTPVPPPQKRQQNKRQQQPAQSSTTSVPPPQKCQQQQQPPTPGHCARKQITYTKLKDCINERTKYNTWAVINKVARLPFKTASLKYMARVYILDQDYQKVKKSKVGD